MEDADVDALEKTKIHLRKIRILHQEKTKNLPQKAKKEKIKKILREEKALQKKTLQKEALLEEDKLIKMIKKYSTKVFLVKKLILL